LIGGGSSIPLLSISRTIMTIKVDAEFHSFIPALSDADRALLEENIRSDGEIFKPLLVWKEQGILLDGHNRKEIGDALGIGYRVKELNFPDRTSALIWMCYHQFG